MVLVVVELPGDRYVRHQEFRTNLLVVVVVENP